MLKTRVELLAFSAVPFKNLKQMGIITSRDQFGTFRREYFSCSVNLNSHPVFQKEKITPGWNTKGFLRTYPVGGVILETLVWVVFDANPKNVTQL